MKKFMTTMTTALLATGVLAAPTIYPKDPSLLMTITNTTNSNLVADDSDPRVIWVMPPNSAFSKVGSLHTITANIGFCSQMAKIQTYTEDLVDGLQELQKNENRAIDELDGIRQKISDANQELAQYVSSNMLQDIANLDARLTDVEDQISVLNGKLETCTDKCSEFSGQLSELRRERTKLAKDRRAMAKDKIKLVREMDRKKASVEGYQNDLVAAENKYKNLKQEVLKLHSDLLGMYKEFAKMEGARAPVSFESTWDANIQELEKNNAGFEFKQIHTENATIRTSLMAGNALPGDSAVMSYEMSGKAVEGGIEFPSYPPSFSANLRLSLIGACPIIHPGLFNIPVENTTDLMNYGMIISYEYPTVVEAKLQIKYTMYKMYEKIVKSKTKGGFFSSSKKTSITEKNFFKEDFKTQWFEDDAKVAYTEEEKADIEKDIRDDMFARLAANALPAIPNPGLLIAGDAPVNGAAVLGSSLAKNKQCQVNKWCAAATIGVNVLNAVFGGSTSAAKFTSIHHTEQTVDWSRKQVVMKPWISSYR